MLPRNALRRRQMNVSRLSYICSCTTNQTDYVAWMYANLLHCLFLSVHTKSAEAASICYRYLVRLNSIFPCEALWTAPTLESAFASLLQSWISEPVFRCGSSVRWTASIRRYCFCALWIWTSMKPCWGKNRQLDRWIYQLDIHVF